MKTPQPDLELYLTTLRTLPFVEDARIEPRAVAGKEALGLLLQIRAAGRPHHFGIVHTGVRRLNYGVLEAKLAQFDGARHLPRILFAPYITDEAGKYLREKQVYYVDALGNCWIALGKNHVAAIEGRRPPRDEQVENRVTGPTGYLVWFALLADRNLAQEPVRTIAARAGVGKTQAANVLTRLMRDGLIADTGKGRFLLRPDELLHRWLAVYPEQIRPRLLVGRFRGPYKDPVAFEQALEADEQREGTARWAYGGAAGGYRLTKYYRGDETVLHVEGAPDDLLRRTRLLRAREGNIVIYRAPGPITFEGPVPFAAHPLLVYTELLADGGPRERETALEIREQYLRDMP